MKSFVTSSQTEFFKLAVEILGHRKHVKELLRYYQSHPDKINLWFGEIDEAIARFNSQEIPDYCLNAIYLKKIWQQPLPGVKTVAASEKYLRPTLQAMNKFEFFDDQWELEKLAAACVVAFYRTFILVSQPYIKEKNAQVASAIEESLALMALNGRKTKLFDAVKHWIMDWKDQGFSKALAERVRKFSYVDKNSAN